MPFGFDGEQTDPENGLVYLRARYYDPTTGRFLTQDPLPGTVGQSRYAFAQNNPVTQSDPTGMDSCATFSGMSGSLCVVDTTGAHDCNNLWIPDAYPCPGATTSSPADSSGAAPPPPSGPQPLPTVVAFPGTPCAVDPASCGAPTSPPPPAPTEYVPVCAEADACVQQAIPRRGRPARLPVTPWCRRGTSLKMRRRGWTPCQRAIAVKEAVRSLAHPHP
ncbi:MAG: RHS repeat-associated core domain-containing protein, partial [Trebonia sp.]